MSQDEPLVATASQTVGPFFHFGLRAAAGRARRARADTQRIHLVVSVFDGDGAPLDDALVEFWESGATVDDPAECGRMATGADGSCDLDLAAPGRRHLNLCIFARGLLRQLYTRVYFARDAALDSDPVLALVPADRRATLIAQPDPQTPGRWRFDVHLQGPRETVFFDR